jgi:tetratricopeptide (TPR) repeat protein
MSVIFKTLKKLRGQSPEGKERDEKLKRGRNIYSFRKIAFSPTGILFIVLLVFFSGMATIYCVRYLKDYFEQKSRESFLRKEEKAQIVNSEIGKEGDELAKKKDIFEEVIAVPPPPKNIPIEEASPEKLYLPSTSNKKFPPQETRIVRYTPPKFPNNTQGQEKKITSVEVSRQSPVSQKEISKPLTPTSATSLPPSSEMSQTSLSSILKMKAHPEQDTKELPDVGPDSVKRDRAKSPAIQPPSKVLPKVAVNKKPTTAGKRVLSERPERLKERKKEEDERIRLENVEKSAKIASLVAKIRRSMDTRRSDQIEDLIDELALLKGKENGYVLKLRAFLYMRNDDYESAALLLNDVLRKNENDLEAGINMAIVEVKTSQIPEAIKRLAKLREIYPEDTLIPELIQKLK